MAGSKLTGDALIDAFTPALPDLPEEVLLSGKGLALEAAQFWAHRMRAYASYFERLGACKRFSDFADLQSRFWTDVQRDYANEVAALAAVATGTGLSDFAQPRSAPAP